ncbi:MAG TPA: nucleotide sugar dehydrogenase [Firmicutes bacterium]|nr:nucleotide sugar dehydrogenase [Bacillota bacterium]
MHSDILRSKLEDKSAVVGIIGLGYVGLPLLVNNAMSGFYSIGFDIDKTAVDTINAGKSHILDVSSETVRELRDRERLSASYDFARLADCDVIAICVPTPIDNHYQPDISYVRSAAEEVAANVTAGTLVVLESTTYPGTTEEVIQPLLEKRGFEIGNDIFLAFSAERVDPGNKKYNTRNTPKVVGGVTQVCTDLAALYYSTALEGAIHPVSSPKVAEIEKILENSFRFVNIALVNEFAKICEKMDIPIWEVIDAAKTKPYGFMAFYPGPGPGGHCIPVDPMYLTYKAKEYKCSTSMIETACEINSGMPQYCVSRVSDILNTAGKPLNGSKVLMLGMAYKPDINDLRESPAVQMAELFIESGCDFSYNDPFIPQITCAGKCLKSAELNKFALNAADIVVVATNHSAYDANFIANNANLIFDTRNLTAGIVGKNIHRL